MAAHTLLLPPLLLPLLLRQAYWLLQACACCYGKLAAVSKRTSCWKQRLNHSSRSRNTGGRTRSTATLYSSATATQQYTLWRECRFSLSRAAATGLRTTGPRLRRLCAAHCSPRSATGFTDAGRTTSKMF